MTPAVTEPCRRGRPLLGLGGLLAGWVAIRVVAGLQMPTELAAMMDGGETGVPSARVIAGSVTMGATRTQPGSIAEGPVAAPRRPSLRPVGPIAPVPAYAIAPARPVEAVTPHVSPDMVAGQNLLWMAAMRAVPLERGRYAALAGPAPRSPAPPGRAAVASAGAAAPSVMPRRWSGDGWALVRGGSSSALSAGAIGPTYGGSQAGAVVRYALAPSSPRDPRAYLRAAGALARSPDRDLALGLSAAPLPAVPLRLHAEARLTASGGSGTAERLRMRPAAFVTTGVDRQLANGLSLRGYGAAGAIGGPGGTGFADGSLVADHRVLTPGGAAPSLSVGAGAWGGVQRGGGRLDIGPTASLSVRIGEAQGRLSADYRLRVAGKAQPVSGPAITLSAGF